MNRTEQKMGASLVTVLMIVAAMSAIAVGITQSITQGVSRAKVLDGQAQLRVSVVAAEAYGQYELTKLLLDNEGRLSPDMPGFFAPLTQTFGDGTITLNFIDKTNCFDLNRLGLGDLESDISASSDEILQLVKVLEAAGIDKYAAQIFAESVADWIDSDTLAMLRGAENTYYESESAPVRSRGQWLFNQTEMYGIRGFAAEIREIAPELLCARPRSNASPPMTLFNINTINNTQLPLLVAAYDGALDLSTLEDALRRRPIGGWSDIDGFVADTELTDLNPEFIAKGEISVFSKFVQADFTLKYREMVAEYEVLYELSMDAPVKIVRRRRSG